MRDCPRFSPVPFRKSVSQGETFWCPKVISFFKLESTMSCPANFLGLGGGGVGGRLFPHMSSTQLTSVELFQPRTKKKGKSQNVCDVSLSDQKPRCPRRGGREVWEQTEKEAGHAADDGGVAGMWWIQVCFPYRLHRHHLRLCSAAQCPSWMRAAGRVSSVESVAFHDFPAKSAPPQPPVVESPGPASTHCFSGERL